MLVEPAGGDTIIRMRTLHGGAQRMAGASMAMVFAVAIMVFTTFMDGRALGDVYGNMMLLMAALFGAGALLVTRVRGWSRTRQAQMEALGRRIEQRRPAPEQSALSETDRAARIELPDLEDEAETELARARGREQG